MGGCERVMGTDDGGNWRLLEDLHGQAVGVAGSLEDEVRPRGVVVAPVAGPHLLDREAEGRRGETLSDDQKSDMSIPPSTWSETPVM